MQKPIVSDQGGLYLFGDTNSHAHTDINTVYYTNSYTNCYSHTNTYAYRNTYSYA